MAYNSISQDKARVYVDNIMNQFEEMLLSSAEGVREAAMAVSYDVNIQEYLVADEPLRRMQLYNEIKNSMNYLSATNRTIYNMILVDTKSRIFSLYSTDYYNILNQLGEKYDFMNEEFDQSLFTVAFRESPNSHFYLYAYITPIFSSAVDTKPKTKIGTCILLNRIDDLQSAIKRISLTENSIFLIEDKDGNIIASNRTSLVGGLDKLDYAGFDLEKQDSVDIDGMRSIVHNRIVDGLDFRLTSILPVHEIAGDIDYLKNFGLIMGAIMAALLILISFLFLRGITRPVQKIADFLESIKGKHLHKRLDISGPNEIGQLALNINNMLSSIEDMTGKILKTQSTLYEMKIEKQYAELSALQSQINPHFLYNTLNCIQSMGLSCGSMEIVNVAAALVKIFRYSIKGSEYVKIRDEVDCVRNYLDIMAVRYNGKFTTHFDIEQEIMDMKTIKMILQPIVENAIYHGLECKKGSGRLEVKGILDVEHNIRFEITDDGKGIAEAELANITRQLRNIDLFENRRTEDRKSVGLLNVHKRIRLHFGEPYGISIESSENNGTKVIVKLPSHFEVKELSAYAEYAE